MWWKVLPDDSKRCASIRVYEWLGKIWIGRFTTERCVLQQDLYKGYQWSRLWTCTASLEYHGENDRRLLSQYLPKNRCFAVGGCIWDISEYMLKKLKIESSTFLHCTRISMAGLSRWVLWAWKKAEEMWSMPRRVQASAAYRHRHAVDGWKRYSRQDYPNS